MGGLTAYILAVRFMQNAGVDGVALQSGIWFVITAVGHRGDGRQHLLQWTPRPAGGGRGAWPIALGWLISTTRATAG